MQMTCVEQHTDQAMTGIARLDPGAWEEYKFLRLQALATDPQAFQASYDAARVEPDTYWQRQLRDAANPGPRLIFARQGHGLVGMIGALHTAEDGVAHLTAVFVAPTARGQGFGGALMHAMLQDLRLDRSLRKANLHVNVSQFAAVRLYARFGFRVVEHCRATLGDGIVHDGYKMERALT